MSRALLACHLPSILMSKKNRKREAIQKNNGEVTVKVTRVKTATQLLLRGRPGHLAVGRGRLDFAERSARSSDSGGRRPAGRTSSPSGDIVLPEDGAYGAPHKLAPKTSSEFQPGHRIVRFKTTGLITVRL